MFTEAMICISLFKGQILNHWSGGQFMTWSGFDKPEWQSDKQKQYIVIWSISSWSAILYVYRLYMQHYMYYNTTCTVHRAISEACGQFMCTHTFMCTQTNICEGILSLCVHKCLRVHKPIFVRENRTFVTIYKSFCV